VRGRFLVRAAAVVFISAVLAASTMSAGDIKSEVSIQSISKVFTMAHVIEQSGAQALEDTIGVDATGRAFNSIEAIEQHKGQEINPLVNPGAIATTSMVKGANADEKWAKIMQCSVNINVRDLATMAATPKTN
jgi:glutaminase